MKTARLSISSFVFSLLLNSGVLIALLLLQRAVADQSIEMVLESIFSEEPPQEEITRDLQLETAPAETLNVIAGGTPSATIGASSQPATAPVNIQKAAVMREANIRPVLTEAALPSDSVIGEELGEGEIVGDVGAAVEGYGAAMGVITQEILRMMRESKVTVIWLFDESESLADDRAEIRENYLRVYEELGIASKQDQELRRGSELLLTVVASYGKDIHEHLPRPSADAEQITAAIDSIPIDTSGQENMCQSIAEIIRRYKQTAIRGKRKLAVIVVSDEAGDDGDAVEEAVAEARAAKAPVYFLGRECTFGFPYAHQRWTDEPTGETFWIRIRRGPETPYPECLQWNGLHSRYDVDNSGFGPYEQVRLARETGGIYFVLPGEEQTLDGAGASERRKFDFLSMREYQPDLLSRVAYSEARARSEFRNTIWQVILRLNPNNDKLLFESHDPDLNLANEHFPIQLDAFREAALSQVRNARKSMLLCEEAIALLERVKPLRAKESVPRWRASYDLTLAQLYMFRLRLYQYLLAMDQHANAMPQPKDPMSTEWNFWWGGKPIVPDEAQFSRLKSAFNMKMTREEYVDMVKTEEAATIERLKAVIQDHPGTPWARRAETEINTGFGFHVGERYWNPQRRAEAAKRLPNL